MTSSSDCADCAARAWWRAPPGLDAAAIILETPPTRGAITRTGGSFHDGGSPPSPSPESQGVGVASGPSIAAVSAASTASSWSVELRRRRHDLPRRAVPVEVPDLAVAEGADALDGALDLVDERHDADLLRRRRVDVGRAAARPRHPQVPHVLFREGVDLCLLP